MKILIINSGSSSIKYQLIGMKKNEVLASGLVERIAEKQSHISHKTLVAEKSYQEIVYQDHIPDHYQGLRKIVDLLINPEKGVITNKTEISAVGHRVVHGGENFQSPTIITKQIKDAIKANIPLAPLHNPPNLIGIEVAQSIFPHAPQVAVFDTAFHQTIPKKAFLYALPYKLYKNERVRRYGFHGTSHAYVAEEAASCLGRSLQTLSLITIHLGNGASMAAIKNSQCIDTSMGMTPLEGLVMGTRSGDVDPALPFYLADYLGMSLQDINILLNNESGLKGICGINDMREVLEKYEKNDPLAKIAIEVYCYRIKKYIGAYWAALGHLDALVFTAGIGENSYLIRGICCEGLEELGIEIDKIKNQTAQKGIHHINTSKSKVAILVIPTNEELRIARETLKVINQASSRKASINNYGSLGIVP